MGVITEHSGSFPFVSGVKTFHSFIRRSAQPD